MNGRPAKKRIAHNVAKNEESFMWMPNGAFGEVETSRDLFELGLGGDELVEIIMSCF
jgi:hypothetical protein